MSQQPLFDTALVFADIHLGLKNNLVQHNDDCLNFLEWAADIAHDRNIKTCIFLGDWHHNRKTVQVQTMNHSLKGLKILSDAFERVIMLAGNHDLYYKQNRDLDSVKFAEMFDNIDVVVEPETRASCGLVPWIVSKDDDAAVKTMAADPSIKYIFGHFELAGFRLNGVSSRPSTGSDPMLLRNGHDVQVFTGHFHKRQSKHNVTYVGSPFCHDFGDTDDDERGLMILEWGQDPEFVDWPAGPKYRRADYAELCDDPDALFGAGQVHAQVRVPAAIGWEDVKFIKETLTEYYGLRKFEMLPEREDLELMSDHAGEQDGAGSGGVTLKSVDEVVADFIAKMEGSFDKDLLTKLYLEA